MMDAFAGVAYEVEVHEVRISLSGVNDPVNDKRLMIGQQLTATVTYGGTVPTSGSDTYSWSFSDGDPFANYSASNSTATLTEWASANATATTCYFATPALDIQVAADVTLPAEGLSFTVENELSSIEPSFSIQPYLGTAEFVSGTFPSFTINAMNPSEMALWSSSYNSQTAGMWYVGSVDTPSDFETPAHGDWNWTQVMKGMSRWYRHKNGSYYDYNGNFSGAPRLDTLYPYDGTYTANGSSGVSSDTPGSPIESYMTERSIDDQFDMFMLYRPPGTNSKYVPLHHINWWWLAHGVKGSMPWTFSGRDQNIENSLTYPAHPEWTDNVANYSGYTQR